MLYECLCDVKVGGELFN